MQIGRIEDTAIMFRCRARNMKSDVQPLRLSLMVCANSSESAEYTGTSVRCQGIAH